MTITEENAKLLKRLRDEEAAAVAAVDLEAADRCLLLPPCCAVLWSAVLDCSLDTAAVGCFVDAVTIMTARAVNSTFTRPEPISLSARIV